MHTKEKSGKRENLRAPGDPNSVVIEALVKSPTFNTTFENV
jgi:hypothetical protein